MAKYLLQFMIGQDHCPTKIIHTEAGLGKKRLSFPIDIGLLDDELRHQIWTRQWYDGYYTIGGSLKEILDWCKKYNQVPVVCLNWTYSMEYFQKLYTLGETERDKRIAEFGRTGRLVADLLDYYGFRYGAVSVINEPMKDGWDITKVDYTDLSNAVLAEVNGRYPVIAGNEEMPLAIAKGDMYNYLLDNIKPKKKEDFILGVHLLSDLGKDPNWQLVSDFRTMAAARGYEVICTEGGSWFYSYRQERGHNINKTLIRRCKEEGYEGCYIVCWDVNEKSWPTLGYIRWDKNYTRILNSPDELVTWDDFKNFVIKEGYRMPVENRTVTLTWPYMYGSDVREIQVKLLELGYDLGKWGADGVYGPMSERSVYSFKMLNGILGEGEKNAVVDKATKNTLMNTPLDELYPEVFKNIYETSNFDADAIDYYLYVKAHPDLRGHGKYFVQAEAETGIPAEWQLANGAQESSYKGGGIGSSPVAQKYNNLYGWAVTDSGVKQGAGFSSFADCILKVAHSIKDLFLDSGNWRYRGDTISGIEYYYSTAPYNAVMKARYYRQICDFLAGPIKHPIPEFIEDLTDYLDNYYVRKEQ
jgi:hypothetical protein